jgi:hypothetical protein
VGKDFVHFFRLDKLLKWLTEEVQNIKIYIKYATNLQKIKNFLKVTKYVYAM